MEGISHEAIGLAGMQKLSKLIVLWDDNNISIDGEVALSDRTDQPPRFAAAGWQVHRLRRPRPRRHRRGAHRGRSEPAARHDRLQDPYRLRLADQAGHRKAPRLPARRRRDRRRSARPMAGTTRRSTSPTTSATPGRPSAAAAPPRGTTGRSASARLSSAQARDVRGGDRRHASRPSSEPRSTRSRRRSPKRRKSSRRANPPRWCSR